MSEKTITVEWEFNIGDVVTLKEGVEAFYFSDQLSGFPERKPNVFEITERITQENYPHPTSREQVGELKGEYEAFRKIPMD